MRILFPLMVAATAASTALWHSAETFELRVAPEPMPSVARRVGINLGHWTSWGAEQLPANVIKNPGFEPVLDRSIVIVRSAGPHSFTDDTDWLARPDSFWDGGAYSVRSGSLAGREGGIVHSATRGGFARFDVAETLAGLQPGDVIAVTRSASAESPALWWYSREGDASIGVARGSGVSGLQSLVLTTRGGIARASSYLDAIGDRGGKLLPLNGSWQLAFGVRSAQGHGDIRVTLRREGRPVFFDERISLTNDWQQVTRRLTPDDWGPAGVLELRFEVSGENQDVQLDDVSLQASTKVDSAFRSEVVSALEALRPGYLRDWQGQLGDSLENRLANSVQRRPFRYRPGGETSIDYGYSLPDFLELCDRVSSKPWVVLPTTMADAEWIEAGRYLSEAAERFGFEEIVVEFGNENWNPLFRPAGIPVRAARAAAAGRAFRLLQEGADGDRRLVAAAGEQPSSETDDLPLAPGVLFAIAPYWTYELNPAQGLRQLFPSHAKILRRAANKGGAIYEMNAHTLGASATMEETNRLVTSRAAGTAMAWHAMAGMSAGLSRQCAYVLAGLDAFSEGRDRLIRLFGVTRDLAGAVWLRPTGMALSMLNRVITSEAHAVETGSEDLQAIAFRHGERWRLAVASRRSEPSVLRIRFPHSGSIPVRAITLGGADPYANNEEQQQVSEVPISLLSNRRMVEVTLPAFGFAVLLEEEVKNGN